MKAIENLLILYAGLVLINTIIAGLLWYRQRTALFRILFFVWTAAMTAFVAQGALSHSNFLIVIGYSFTFLTNLSLSFLFGTIVEIKVPWRLSLLLLGIGYLATVILNFFSANFTILALPITVAAVFPLLTIVLKTLRGGRWSQLSFLGKSLWLISVVTILHIADFPFLRNIEAFALMGFTIAILIIFALSIVTLAVVLEITTEEETRVSAELEIARRIQTEILPDNPLFPGHEVACYMQPADEVGGDYYDIYSFKEGSWIFVGDVTGHGLGAGLVMLMGQSIMSSILHTQKDISPGRLNYIANQILFNNLSRLVDKRFMAVASIYHDRNENRFTVSGCQSIIFIYRAARKEVEEYRIFHFPCGLGFSDEFDQNVFIEETFRLNSRDLIFVGTDGIMEAAPWGNYDNELYGEERIKNLLREKAESPLDEIKASLLDSLEKFTHGVYTDDVTFVLIRAE